MHISRQEWRSLQGAARSDLRTLYARLHAGDAGPAEAADFLREEIEAATDQPCSLPESPQGLLAWMDANTVAVHARYAGYLDERKNGGPRRYFRNRAHALYVLRNIAPTKLVDGAWLHGLLGLWRDPRCFDLVRTCIEELGEGIADKNHVALYRGLLSRYGLDPLDGLVDGLYQQGAVQLALGACGDEFLPEVVGFNLAYEQLPLHLLITAHELDELGIDPYYFTLHVTVDNPSTGHARRACDSVLALMPAGAEGERFWERVRAGARLADAGVCTTQVIAQFDIDQEVVRIMRTKCAAGAGAHATHCRVAGRAVADWLSSPQDMPSLLQALAGSGWIRRDAPATESRFWSLLQGERAAMFGVFSAYELQVIHDWLRGDASADGLPFTRAAEAGRARVPTFRAAQQLARMRGGASAPSALPPAVPAADLDACIPLLAPARHWTPEGLAATRSFWAALAS